MNNLDKIKLTVSARDSHREYGMYREVEDREKYLSIKITERAKNLLNTSDINACALDCRIHYKNDDTKVTLSTLVDIEDYTTRKEVLECIIKALDENMIFDQLMLDFNPKRHFYQSYDRSGSITDMQH